MLQGEGIKRASLVAQPIKNLPANAGDMDSIPEWGRYPGEEKGNPLQSSCLENPRDRGAWWATGHGGHKVFDTTEVTENACKGKKKRNEFFILSFF